MFILKKICFVSDPYAETGPASTRFMTRFRFSNNPNSSPADATSITFPKTSPMIGYIVATELMGVATI